MSRTNWIVFMLFLAFPVMASADDDLYELWSWLKSFDSYKGVNVVQSEVYKEECGSCHFAYQPGLLPQRSWIKLLTATALEDHFGENAELDEETLAEIKSYALDNAADDAYFKRSKKMMASLADDEAPLRITEVRYFKRKHAEIPEKLIKGNSEVRSLSFCDSCHTAAAKGSFDDDDVYIPGYGRWDD
jgi:hypothetical protein